MTLNGSRELVTTLPTSPPSPIGELERVTNRAILRKNGSPNVVAQAELMYGLIFGDISNDDPIIVENNKHSAGDLKKIAKAKELLVKSDNIPSREDFVNGFRHQVTHTPINEAIFPGSVDTLETLSSLGVVCIWTSGDTHGSDLASGSAEQYKRIVRAGLTPSSFRSQRENIFAHSHEDKINSLGETISRFVGRGVKNIVIVDDRLKNLIDAREFIATNFPSEFPPDAITLVWDQESVNGESSTVIKTAKGFGGDPKQEAIEYGVILVASNSEVCPIVQQLPSPGILIDLDDVLIDEDKTTQLRMGAVTKWFTSQGWISSSLSSEST